MLNSSGLPESGPPTIKFKGPEQDCPEHIELIPIINIMDNNLNLYPLLSAYNTTVRIRNSECI